MTFDVFISHASEDKDAVARPLAAELAWLGLNVWFDECQLAVGDSLRRSIDKGLSESKYGVVILSPAFFSKEWPQKELDGLVSREDGGEKVVLPVWHEVTATDISRISPILASKLSVSTQQGLATVAKNIWHAVTNNDITPRSVQQNSAEYEAQLLSKLRTQMLTADSSWQLRQSVYELDEHLARYPHSPEARLLRDQMEQAKQRAEQYEQPAMASQAPEANMKYQVFRVSHLSLGLWVGLILVLLGVLAYFFFL